MKRKPIVLIEGKLNQLDSSDGLTSESFSYHTIADEVVIPNNQIMLTTQLELTTGTLEILGSVEIL